MTATELDALISKYRKETGLEPTMSRLKRAQEFLKMHRLTPKQVRFENHSDPMWPKRNVRTELEALSDEIGYTNARVAGGNHSRWFIVPLVKPPEKATKATKKRSAAAA